MNTEEQQYLDLLKELLESDSKEDRTGVGTLSKFGHQMRFSLEDGTLPLLTTKKVFFRGVVEELLFFIRGERDSKKLEAKGVNIWRGNTSREFLDNRGLTDYKEGDMGPMYGSLWRDFDGVDQLQNSFDTIKSNPTSRRNIVTAYNPAKAHLGVLYPCHTMFQFNVRDDKLDCLWVQRSVDTFLGLGFNITSYAVLTHMMAKAAGLKTGDLIFQGGDTHLYKNHIEQAKEQLSREPHPFPTLKINKDINSIDDMEKLVYEDFELVDYKCHPSIKAEMAV
jgi:thymidylate synthase